MSNIFTEIAEYFQTLFSKVKSLVKKSVVTPDSNINETINDVLDGHFNEIAGDIDALIIKYAQANNTDTGADKMAKVIATTLQKINIPAYIALFAGNLVIKSARAYVQSRYNNLVISGDIIGTPAN